MKLAHRIFGRAAGGQVVFPLLILAALYFFDEFDTAAFGVLTPDIERSFHINDNQILGLVVLNVSITALFAIPLGYYADRLKRTPIVVLSGLIAGAFSLMTGLVGSVALLIVARSGNGVGLLANDPVHNSLLADYYRPESRPAVFAAHKNALYLGAIVGPALAGALSSAFGWRSVFFVLMAPIIVTALIARRLVEPVRGETDDAGSALAMATERPMSFKESWRTLVGVRTLKYQYWAAVLFGAGFVPIATYMSLYYQRVFGVGSLGRGAVAAAAAAATYVGVIGGGRLTPRLIERGSEWPLRVSGLALAWFAVCLLVIVASPWVSLAVAFYIIGSFGVGYFFAPFYATQSLVSPARARSLSFSLTAVFVVVGGVAFFALGLGRIADHDGIRWGIFAGIPFWLGAAGVLGFVGRFVGPDARRAASSLAAAWDARRQLDDDASEQTLLHIAGVDAAYDGVQVLFGVDLRVGEGEIVALLGTNGAGKSTLLRCISGLMDPVGGNVIFAGSDTTHAGAAHAVRAGIIQMPGGRSVFPTLTVDECLRLAGSIYRRRDPDHVSSATKKVLEFFPVLASRGTQLAGDLSGGEQQMLGLSMAFIAKPRLLMIDELSLGLAPVVVGQLIDIVKRIHAEGTTIILVEQSVNVALTLAERAVFMEKGEVKFTGRTADLLERDDLLRSVFLEGAAARERPASRPPAEEALAPDGPAVLSARSLCRHFGGIPAVDDVSFDLFQGEILGVIGPNGAGKTTMFDLLSGQLDPDRGTVALLGADVTRWAPHRRALAGLGRSSRTPGCSRR